MSIVRKWMYSILITFAVLLVVSYIAGNTKIKFDKDSKYTAKIPDTMRVANVYNKSEKEFYKNILVKKTNNVPEPKDDEVLVYVKSATFTQQDFDFFKNNPNKKEYVPCTDFSGIVAKVGKNVKLYEIGDKVFGIVDVNRQQGACADYVAVPQNNVYSIPYSLSFQQAASIPTPALLNWFAVHNLEKNNVKNGKVLIDDAISETGIMLTGMLVRNGFEVSAIDDESVGSWVSSFGVKKFIANTNFANEKKDLVKSYDVVINLKNGLSQKELIDCVKTGGVFLSFEPTNVKRNDIKTLIIDNTKIDKTIFAKMARLVHLGKLQINVAQEHGLEHIRDAYVRAKKGNNNGKVVVVVHK